MGHVLEDLRRVNVGNTLSKKRGRGWSGRVIQAVTNIQKRPEDSTVKSKWARYNNFCGSSEETRRTGGVITE